MSEFEKQIVVIGSHSSTPDLNDLAYKTGLEIAKYGYYTVCGGREGVMEYACKGAKENGGTTIGITPDLDPSKCNPYVDIVIPTGINFSRNYIVQNSGSAIIMIGGSYGTLSELSYALQFNKKVISLSSKWSDISDKIIKAKTPEEAVKLAIN